VFAERGETAGALSAGIRLEKRTYWNTRLLFCHKVPKLSGHSMHAYTKHTGGGMAREH
jgi:hypothetical protein